ncbi:MAG TPA: GapR family DNA-binding domain-containing protein, partial [Bosea sp. (in: a-proteobacteria)]|nr:GapR family DNA-binding domain-containing protein [Bosea sp. (in: a-proteobacteria)]
YDVKVLRKVIALRKRDLNERQEEEAILELYLQAVGESA